MSPLSAERLDPMALDPIGLAERDILAVKETLEGLGRTMIDGFEEVHLGDIDTNEAQDPPSPELITRALVEVRKIPGMPSRFYNAAAWEHEGKTLMLGRYVKEPAPEGEPDVGSLLLAVLEEGSVTSIDELWRPEAPEKKGDLLEDVRVVVTPNSEVLIGCTRVIFNTETGKYEPFPAVAVASSEALLRGEFPDTEHVKKFGEGRGTTPVGEIERILQLLPGKNFTPLKQKDFMFRQKIHKHELTIFSRDEDNQFRHLQELKFPEPIPEWGEDTMGTTMPPVWLNEREALFFVHGFKKINGKPKYAIGSARLFINDSGEYEIDNVSESPLLTTEMLESLFPGVQVQLHPEEREALYMCGGVVAYDKDNQPETVHAYPSIGDSETVKAVFDVNVITSSWKNREALGQTTLAA